MNRYVSLYLKVETIDELDQIAKTQNTSRNKVARELINYALDIYNKHSTGKAESIQLRYALQNTDDK